MRTRDIHFYSDGLRLVGSLYLPDDAAQDASLPGVIICSGYLGLNAIYPRLLAGPLTEAGYAVLGFDYRGTGESEGEPGRILIHEEGRDIAAGLTFLGLQPEVDASRLALAAWGMGVGCAVPVAAGDERVGALVLLNGFYHGREFLAARHDVASLAEVRRRLEEDRARRVSGERGLWVAPFFVYPLDPATAEEVNRNLRPVAHFGPDTALELAESLLALDLDPLAPGLSMPLFVGHGRENALHPPEQATRFCQRAPEPRTMRWIEGRHNDFMQADNPIFMELMRDITGWLGEHLTARAPTRS